MHWEQISDNTFKPSSGGPNMAITMSGDDFVPNITRWWPGTVLADKFDMYFFQHSFG